MPSKFASNVKKEGPLNEAPQCEQNVNPKGPSTMPSKCEQIVNVMMIMMVQFMPLSPAEMAG